MKDQILMKFVEDFVSHHGLGEQSDGDQFAHFVNYCVVSKATSDTLDLHAISTGGGGDMGIDGIAILIEGHLVQATEDVDFFRDRLGRLSVDFVFTQAKSASAFRAADIGTFISGVRSFFGTTLPSTANDLVKDAFDLKTYIYEQTLHMEVAPRVFMNYASSGEWANDAHVQHRMDEELAPLRKNTLFSQVVFTPLDASSLRSAYRSIQNKTVCEVTFEKHTILPPIPGVTEAYLGLLPCREYIKLICDSDDALRRGLFYDNVRDYQGENSVNREIAKTLTDGGTAGQFVLLNNGVTVVARSIAKVGAKFKITDYQIVNGCQTSHVLFSARESLSSDVNVPIKLVVTNDPELTNRVIRGTNRQTEVKIEAFESLSPFHRVLEEFFVSFPETRRLYYERRSGQYAAQPVSITRVVSLATLAKAFLGMFLDEPQSTHRYYGEILANTRGRMFEQEHSPYPYYTSALALIRVTEFLRKGLVSKDAGRFRFHLMLLIRLAAGGNEKPPLNSKKIDEYCRAVCEKLWDDDELSNLIIGAWKVVQERLRDTPSEWRLAPRLRDFTNRLLPYKRQRARGIVKYFNEERGFGFIEIQGHEDIFVHHSSAVNRAESCLRQDEHVEFDIVKTDRGPQARNLVVVPGDKK